MKSLSKYFSLVGNLLKAMLGSGFLPMPTLYYCYGIIPTTVLLVLGAICGMIGLNLFLTLNAYYGKNSTLSTLAYEICPVLRYVADIAVCLKCLMVSLAYIVLIKNQIDIVVKVLNLPFSSKIPLLIFVLFVIVISSLGKFDKLKYTSLIGLCALLIMMLLSFFLIKKVHHIPMFNIKLDVFGKLGTFVYAFTCHQAILGMQNELRYQLSFFRKSIFIVCSVAFLLFMTFGIVNGMIYDYMATGTLKSWEQSLPNSFIGAVIRIILSLVVLLSVPIQMTAFISYFLGLFDTKYNTMKIRLSLSFIALMIIYFITLSNINLLKIIEIVGCTVSAFMCQILPSTYFILADDGVKKKPLLISAYFLLSVGIFIALVGIYDKVSDVIPSIKLY